MQLLPVLLMDRSYSLESEVSHTQTMTWGDTEHGSTLNTFKLRMYKSILAQMQKYRDPKGKSLLDVGCSIRWLHESREGIGSMNGFDIVPQAVDFVRKNGMVGRMLRVNPPLPGTDENV